MTGQYDMIIIGAGLTGLSTALAWKKIHPQPESRVLVLERNPIPGGCVTTFARQGFKFDTTQIIPNVNDLLEFFDIDIPLKRFEGYYARHFMVDPTHKTVPIYNIPSSVAEFSQSLQEKYPEDAPAIKKFFDYCVAMYAELQWLKTEPRWHQLPSILIHCPKIIANSSKTYQQFLMKFGFKNKEVTRILDTFSSFSGLSGDRCAALLTACAMITTLNGSYRPEKGFIQFPVALKKKAEEFGVEFRFRTTVKQILVNGNKVLGVITEKGGELLAHHVVCTADTKVAYRDLLGYDILKKLSTRFHKKVHEAAMSPSGFSIHLGLDDDINLAALGFNCGYNVLTSGADALSQLFEGWDRDELIQSDNCFHIAAICPSLMTGGKNTLILHVVPVPANYWIRLKQENRMLYDQQKQTVAAFYINKIEQYMIPDLKKHILFTDISTPATYLHYLGTPTGSQYDMLPVPSNFGKNRLPTRTPVKGLFVPKFSHGIWPCMQAGLQVTDMITGGKIMKGNSSYSHPKSK